MLLALDIGNTNITAGVFDGEEMAEQWRISTQRDRTADELAALLKVLFATRDLQFSDVQGVAVSSVVPSLTPQAAHLSTRYFGCEPLIVGPAPTPASSTTTRIRVKWAPTAGERPRRVEKIQHRCCHR
jgi:type III pantothenate kinase